MRVLCVNVILLGFYYVFGCSVLRLICINVKKIFVIVDFRETIEKYIEG